MTKKQFRKKHNKGVTISTTIEILGFFFFFFFFFFCWKKFFYVKKKKNYQKIL